MGLVVRKMQGGAEDRIRSLVAEHAQSLEPGLSVLETSLRLGRTTIDVVALDAKQTLVLVVASEVADEKMLVGTLDAYVWCLAHPESVQRRYPTASIAITRPPRVIFVAERIPDTFVELVERLSVVPVECQELAGRPIGATASAVAPETASVPPTPVAPAAPKSPEARPAPSRRLAPAQIAAWLDAGLAQQRENSASNGSAPPIAAAAYANGHTNGHAKPESSAPLAGAMPAAEADIEQAPVAAPPDGHAAKNGAPDQPAKESLKFPKDGVSRQWQDFLDQLAAANK